MGLSGGKDTSVAWARWSNLAAEKEASMTTEKGERNTRGLLNLVLVLIAAVLSAYLVFLWLN